MNLVLLGLYQKFQIFSSIPRNNKQIIQHSIRETCRSKAMFSTRQSEKSIFINFLINWWLGNLIEKMSTIKSWPIYGYFLRKSGKNSIHLKKNLSEMKITFFFFRNRIAPSQIKVGKTCETPWFRFTRYFIPLSLIVTIQYGPVNIYF